MHTDSTSFGQNATTATTLKQFTRIGQIITFALANGMIMIGVVFLVIGAGENKDQDNTMLFLAIGLGAFVVTLVMAFVLPAILRSQAISRFRNDTEVAQMRSTNVIGDEQSRQRERWIQWDQDDLAPQPLIHLLAANQSANIVGQALLEGGAVINLVFFLMTGSFAHLAVVVLALIGVISMFPTVGKLRSLIARGLDVRTT